MTEETKGRMAYRQMSKEGVSQRGWKVWVAIFGLCVLLDEDVTYTLLLTDI
jgi:hypothetical protein